MERKGIEPSTFALRTSATRNAAQSSTKENGQLSPISARDFVSSCVPLRGSVHQICTRVWVGGRPPKVVRHPPHRRRPTGRTWSSGSRPGTPPGAVLSPAVDILRSDGASGIPERHESIRVASPMRRSFASGRCDTRVLQQRLSSTSASGAQALWPTLEAEPPLCL